MNRLILIWSLLLRKYILDVVVLIKMGIMEVVNVWGCIKC